MREATEIVNIHSTRHTGSLKIRGNQFQSNSTASALIAQNSSVQCVYCNEAHYSASCKRVPGSQEHKEIQVGVSIVLNLIINPGIVIHVRIAVTVIEDIISQFATK